MLVLKRKWGWGDKFRAYHVIVDEQDVGSIREGKEVRFDLAPGSHEVYLKIDWSRSRTITIEANDGDVFLECRAKGPGRQGQQDYMTFNQVFPGEPAK
jgi:hypothetical protein